MIFTRPSLLKILGGFFLVLVVLNAALAKEKNRTDGRVIEPEPIDKEWNELPRNYRSTTPKAAFDWLEKLISSEPPTDQFSSPNEIALRDEVIRKKIEEKSIFGILIAAEMNEDFRTPCRLRYSPNEEKLSYSLGSSRYTEYKHSSRPTDNLRKIMLESKFSDRGESIGQNAFGAKVKISRLSYKDISVAAKDAGGVGIASIPPERARMVVPQLKCLVLFSPTPPFVLQQWDTVAASFENPVQISTEDLVLFGQIENIWLINSSNRQVIAKQR